MIQTLAVGARDVVFPLIVAVAVVVVVIIIGLLITLLDVVEPELAVAYGGEVVSRQCLAVLAVAVFVSIIVG